MAPIFTAAVEACPTAVIAAATATTTPSRQRGQLGTTWFCSAKYGATSPFSSMAMVSIASILAA